MTNILHEILQLKENIVNTLGYVPENITMHISRESYDQLVKYINDNYILVKDESLKDNKGLIVFDVNIECWERS